jgi:hypothetical protein
MAAALPLRAALERGALITLANWPVVLIDFLIESLYKLTLAVPVVGGAFMVAVLLGADVRTLFADGVRSTAGVVLAALTTAPVALWSFLAAVALVGVLGAAVMFRVKAGTLAVLVHAERASGEIPPSGFRIDWFDRARMYGGRLVLDGVARFGGRTAQLAILLGATYAVIAVAYVATLSTAVSLADHPRWGALWPLVVFLATSTGVVAYTAANLVCDLLRAIVIIDDCRVRAAMGKLRTFLVADVRQVVGIFGVMSLVLAIVTGASVTAAAGLYLIAWVPLVGLLIVPLQITAWIVRSLIYQYLGLVTLAAYVTQYRRFGELARPTSAPFLVQPA